MLSGSSVARHKVEVRGPNGCLPSKRQTQDEEPPRYLSSECAEDNIVHNFVTCITFSGSGATKYHNLAHPVVPETYFGLSKT